MERTFSILYQAAKNNKDAARDPWWELVDRYTCIFDETTDRYENLTRTLDLITFLVNGELEDRDVDDLPKLFSHVKLLPRLANKLAHPVAELLTEWSGITHPEFFKILLDSAISVPAWQSALSGQADSLSKRNLAYYIGAIERIAAARTDQSGKTSVGTHRTAKKGLKPT
jgi:hypothetical protein